MRYVIFVLIGIHLLTGCTSQQWKGDGLCDVSECPNVMSVYWTDSSNAISDEMCEYHYDMLVIE